MKNKLMILAVAGILGLVTQQAQAIAIDGTVLFSGDATLADNGGGNYTLDFASPWTVVNGTVDYAGTGGASATFTDFSFGPGTALTGGPVLPLWAFSSGGTNYSFNLNNLVVVALTPGTLNGLNLIGTGVAFKDGFEDTLAIWALQGTSTNLTFRLASASTTATGIGVPDGGTTMVLLGGTLAGLGLLRRKMVA